MTIFHETEGVIFIEQLFIPARINVGSTLGNGFGGKEFKKTLLSVFVGIILGLTIGLVFLNDKMQTVLISSVAGGLLFGVIAYFFNIKNSINLSASIYMNLLAAFLREQKLYKYKRLKEWI